MNINYRKVTPHDVDVQIYAPDAVIDYGIMNTKELEQLADDLSDVLNIVNWLINTTRTNHDN